MSTLLRTLDLMLRVTEDADTPVPEGLDPAAFGTQG